MKILKHYTSFLWIYSNIKFSLCGEIWGFFYYDEGDSAKWPTEWNGR